MLKKKIQTDLNQAIKEGNGSGCSALRMLLAAVLNKEKEKRYKIAKVELELAEKELTKKSALTDEEIIEVVASEVKKSKEAILEFEKGKREKLAEKEKAEIKILEEYLPEQISEEEIRKLVEEAVRKTGAGDIKDMGKVMSEIMPKVKGKAEGGTVSRIVKETLLSKLK